MAHAIVPACLARSPARAGRPPRAGGPLPAARDGEVILDAPACPARSPYRGDGPPLAGLGLPLATSHREGIPDAAYLGALARVLVPAKGGFVLDLPVPEGGGHVCDLDHLLREACREAPGSRAWHLAAPKVTARQLAAIIPTLDLPAAREFWVFREHFDQAMYRLGRCYIIPGMLPKAPPLPAREPLALTAPTPTGPVLASHFMAFFADHQGPGQHLARALNWGHDRGEPYTDAGAAQRRRGAAAGRPRGPARGLPSLRAGGPLRDPPRGRQARQRKRRGGRPRPGPARGPRRAAGRQGGRPRGAARRRSMVLRARRRAERAGDLAPPRRRQVGSGIATQATSARAARR